MSVPPESVVPPPPSEHIGDIPAEERTWAMFGHLSALVGALLTASLWGLACFIGPLVIWLVKKESMPFASDQAKEALNFNITMAIGLAVLKVLLIITFGIGFFIAIPLLGIMWLAWLVLTIIAGVKANEGVRYRYPFALRLIK
jgi:uncharacterized Tic20 family protein